MHALSMQEALCDKPWAAVKLTFDRSVDVRLKLLKQIADRRFNLLHTIYSIVLIYGIWDNQCRASAARHLMVLDDYVSSHFAAVVCDVHQTCSFWSRLESPIMLKRYLLDIVCCLVISMSTVYAVVLQELHALVDCVWNSVYPKAAECKLPLCPKDDLVGLQRNDVAVCQYHNCLWAKVDELVSLECVARDHKHVIFDGVPSVDVLVLKRFLQEALLQRVHEQYASFVVVLEEQIVVKAFKYVPGYLMYARRVRQDDLV